MRLNPQSRILCGFFYAYKSATFKTPASCTARANRVAGVNLAFGINFFRGIKPLLLIFLIKPMLPKVKALRLKSS
ncbi:hypothetical protein, partial [uncultured Pseudoalteromonas sp.]